MFYKTFIYLLLTLFFVGCVSTNVGLSQSNYYSKLKKIRLGMTKSSFNEIFPESIPRGAKRYKNGSVEVLEVSYAYYSFVPTGNRNRNELTGMEGQPQWFYFYKNKLIQYGNPNDWPSRADLVIEKRIVY